MTLLIKLCYAGAITALLVLLVAFGVRTFYAPPEQPEFPNIPPPRPVFPIATPTMGEPPIMPTLTPEQQQLEDAQREYQERFRAYEDERASYRRNVFLAAAVFGVIAVAVGVALAAELDAIRLGLVAGGLGAVLYGVLQAGGDLDATAPAVLFVVAAAGLALIVYAGYRWLSRLDV
jgi:hypothetical protein